MKTTTNYGFKQPEGTDIVNIDDISDNFGSVDTEIKKANDKVIAHEGKGGSVHADVTTTNSGFMSAADKTKLNGIATGAQTNQNAVQSIQVVTPTGTVVGTATAANTTDTIQLKEGNNIDIAVSGKVVTVNNTYSYTHPTGDGNLHVPTTGTSNNGKVLKAGSTAGSLAWGTLTPTDVGALPTSHEGQGGTVHADVTTTVSGFMSAADKTKLNGIAAGAQTNQNAVQSIQAVTSSGTAIGTATAASATDTIQLKEGNNIDIAVSGKTLTLNNTYSYTHPTSDGNLHVPATGTSNSGKVLKAGSTAGSLAWGTLTSTDVGLSNVTNDSQVKRSEMGVANGVSTLDANGVNKQPPISHASAGTSYGVADTSNYGHVKIGNGIAVSSGTISVDVGDGVVLSGTSPNQKLLADVGTGLTLEGTSPNKKIALSNSGVTAGTYEKVTVDAMGRVTSGSDLIASDIPNLPWSKITSGKPTTLDGYGITDGVSASHIGSVGNSHGVATTNTNGFMSVTDKSKLDGIEAGANKYIHPSIHPASMITQDSYNRFVSDSEKNTWNNKADKSYVTNAVSSGNFTMTNGWKAYSYTPGYFKDVMGVVHLLGDCQGGATGAAFTLPSGCYPGYNTYVTGADYATTNAVTIFIAWDGKVTLNSGKIYSLHGISFKV
ncbi:hypothetical protein [Clostridium intestinale]|uniref:Uncharacterized protein n=1 Tax=Clostridium intestinale DSM 6191 TaxID=1121320 RepID=A0A1M6DZR8_9CLOT|nr:hypothetical protein [Clostridium intestinale]SHI78620.1 hypothetical protein SAMN02745941_04340 [Clostridium intestinale DSM 6191]